MVGPRTSRAFPGPTALWAILACVLWGSAFPGVRIALQYAPPLLTAGLRFILAGMLLLPLCGRPAAMGVSLRKHWRLVLTVSFLQTTLLYGTFFLGMSLIRGAQGAVIIGSAPLVSAMMAHFLMHDDRMTAARAVAIVLGMTGVAILAIQAKPWSSAGLVEIGGMGLLLVGVISSAMSGILVAKNRKGISPFVLNSAQMTLGGVVLLIVGLLVHGPLPAGLPGAYFGSLLWLATISATGFSIWFALLKREKVSELNMWKFVIPLSGVLLSWMLAPGEGPNWHTAAGMVCVVVAVLLNQWHNGSNHARCRHRR